MVKISELVNTLNRTMKLYGFALNSVDGSITYSRGNYTVLLTPDVSLRIELTYQIGSDGKIDLSKDPRYRGHGLDFSLHGPVTSKMTEDEYRRCLYSLIDIINAQSQAEGIRIADFKSMAPNNRNGIRISNVELEYREGIDPEALEFWVTHLQREVYALFSKMT